MTVVGAVAAAVAYREAVRRFERRVPEELAAAGRAEFGVGALAVGLLVGVVLVILWLLDIYAVVPGPPRWGNLPTVIGAALFAGVGLELVLQGAVLRGVERVAGTIPAIVASALLSGLTLYVTSTARSGQAVVGAALGLGVVTACAYVATRRQLRPCHPAAPARCRPGHPRAVPTHQHTE